MHLCFGDLNNCSDKINRWWLFILDRWCIMSHKFYAILFMWTFTPISNKGVLCNGKVGEASDNVSGRTRRQHLLWMACAPDFLDSIFNVLLENLAINLKVKGALFFLGSGVILVRLQSFLPARASTNPQSSINQRAALSSLVQIPSRSWACWDGRRSKSRSNRTMNWQVPRYSLWYCHWGMSLT